MASEARDGSGAGGAASGHSPAATPSSLSATWPTGSAGDAVGNCAAKPSVREQTSSSAAVVAWLFADRFSSTPCHHQGSFLSNDLINSVLMVVGVVLNNDGARHLKMTSA